MTARNACEPSSRSTQPSEAEAKLQVTPAYADGWKLLEFLERIQHANRNQYIVFYDTPAACSETSRGRLSAMSPHVITWLLADNWPGLTLRRCGGSGLLRDPSATHEYLSPLRPPPSHVVSAGSRKRTPSSLLAALQRGVGTVLLTGPPGGGKSPSNWYTRQAACGEGVAYGRIPAIPTTFP